MSSSNFISVNMILTVVTVLLLASSTDARCLGDPPSTANSCTANDVRISELVRIGDGLKSCVIGSRVEVTLRAHIVATAHERYDIASYVALDGGDAITGVCASRILEPVTTLAYEEDIEGGAGPFPSLEPVPDACGDVRQGSHTWQDLGNMTIACLDVDGDQVADISTCNSWENNKNVHCASEEDAVAGTPSKCRCGKTTIRFLDVCVVDQRDCVGAFCGAAQFEARLVISASNDQSQWAPNSKNYALVYYDFNRTSERIAYEYFEGSQVVAQNGSFAGLEVVKHEVQNPCLVLRHVKCGGACFTLSDNRLVPRWFRDPEDVPGAPSLPALATECPLAFTKHPHQSNATEAIKYLYGRMEQNVWIPCAARAIDGTLFEFYRSDGSRGVHLGTTYDFQAVESSCPEFQCYDAVEIVFALDESSEVDTNDFSRIRQYIASVISSFSEQNNIQFGAIFGSGDICTLTNVHSSFLACLNGHQRVVTSGATNFAQIGMDALDASGQLWTTDKSVGGVPRRLLTIAGSADGSSELQRIAFHTLRIQRGVESWAVGFDAGGDQAMLNALAPGSVPFPRGISLGTSVTLLYDSRYMPLRLCQGTGDLCGGNCAGWCACANDCRCPECIDTTVCEPRVCDAEHPELGCVGDDLNCDDGDPCTVDSCDLELGCVNAAVAADHCDDADACTSDECVPFVGCTHWNISGSCDDGEYCTDDSCEPSSGCVHVWNYQRCPDPTSSPTKLPTTSPTKSPTKSPTTRQPTSVSPTSQAPSSAAPTSKSPTSKSPTSKSPTSQRPTSKSPTSRNPTSKSPTSKSPTSKSPSSAAPTSRSPTSKSPTSKSPTSQRPTSKSPTSKSPTSKSPTSKSPTSKSPTSKSPTSKSPTSRNPTSKSPTSKSPTSKSPTSKSPTSKSPTSKSPTSKSPTSKSPTSKNPTSQSPTSKRPTSKSPTSKSPTSKSPTSKSPTSKSPTSKSPTSKSPTSKSPTSKSPTSKSPTSKSPTSKSPTSRSPTSKAPTATPGPTSLSPTSQSPTSRNPTSQSPTSQSPTSQNPTSQNPTSQSPTSQSPTSQSPTSQNPTSQSPTSRSPTSRNPTSQSPTSQNPTSQNPTSQSPTSRSPTSQSPTSQNPTSQNPTSQSPTSQNPTSQSPTSQNPTSQSPTSQSPTSRNPTSQSPTSQSPTSRSPTSKSPTSKSPTSRNPTSKSPTSKSPTSGSPTSRNPTSKSPTSKSPTSKSPTSSNPTSKSPTSKNPTSKSPTSKSPTSKSPTSRSPTSAEPTTSEPTTAAPTTSKRPTSSPTLTPSSPTTKAPTPPQHLCRTNPCPPSQLPCTVVRCLDECSQALQVDQCATDMLLNGYHCDVRVGVECPDTACNTNECQVGIGCVLGPTRNCSDGNLCTIDSCHPVRGCTHRNVTCAQTSKCFERHCDPSTGACVDGDAIICDDNDSCTVDKCVVKRGCVHEPILCNVSSPCHMLLPCRNGTDDPCEQALVPALLDFCGDCLGDNVACFFLQEDNYERATGLSAGLATLIAVAGVVVLLGAAFGGKKAVDLYLARTQGPAASVKDNPMFEMPNNRGSMPRHLNEPDELHHQFHNSQVNLHN